jgi:hypothetical protein
VAYASSAIHSGIPTGVYNARNVRFPLTILSALLVLGVFSCAPPPPRPPTPTLTSLAFEITFEISGGIGGQYALWTIRSDGQVSRRDQAGVERYMVQPEEASRLMEALRTAGFFALRPVYQNVMCADCFVYVITVNDGQRVHQVRALDAGDLPAEVQAVVRTLKSFVASF